MLPAFTKLFLTGINAQQDMWYLWAMIGCAALTIGIPLFLVYKVDKRKKTAHDRKFRIGRFSKMKKDEDSKS